jgi:hypothetical protein
MWKTVALVALLRDFGPYGIMFVTYVLSSLVFTRMARTFISINRSQMLLARVYVCVISNIFTVVKMRAVSLWL